MSLLNVDAGKTVKWASMTPAVGKQVLDIPASALDRVRNFDEVIDAHAALVDE